MHFLGLAASFNPESLNRSLLKHVSGRLKAAGHDVTLLDYTTLDSPSYDDARYALTGMPAGARQLGDAIRDHDGLLLAMPEYNWSVPGHLKNLIDWLSREVPVVLEGKPVLLMSASPSLQGGVKGLLHMRQSLEALGAFTYPSLLTVSDALRALDADGAPLVEPLQQQLTRVLDGFAAFTHRLHAAAR